MLIQTLSRCGAVALSVAFVAGCTVTQPEQSAMTEKRIDNKCRWNRSSCLYEGSYESGERAYAEDQAKRLNRAQAERLRRGRG